MKIMTRRLSVAAMAIVLVRCGDSRSPTESAAANSPAIVAGSWAGTYSVALQWCNASGVGAEATLQQQGSAVSGTFVIEPNSCGVQGTVDFEGAMNGNSLSGRILRAGTVVSNRVSGSVSNSSLFIDLGRDGDGTRSGSLMFRR